MRRRESLLGDELADYEKQAGLLNELELLVQDARKCKFAENAREYVKKIHKLIDETNISLYDFGSSPDELDSFRDLDSLDPNSFDESDYW